MIHSLLQNEGRKILDEIETEIGIEIETVYRISQATQPALALTYGKSSPIGVGRLGYGS